MQHNLMAVILLIGLQPVVHAQKYSSGDRHILIKIYQNTDYVRLQKEVWSEPQQRYVRSDNFQLYLNRFSVALQMRTPKDWEQELEAFYSNEAVSIAWEQKLGHRPSNFSTRITFLSLQYELLKSFNTADKFSFLLGGGVSPYFVLLEKTPYSTNSFPGEERLIGGTININGHTQYNFRYRWVIDLNLRLGLCDFRYQQTHVANPVLPISAQRSDSFEFKLLPQAYTLRLGVGYRI